MRRHALRQTLIGLVILFILARTGWTQKDNNQSSQASNPAGGAAPDSQDNTPAQSSENPPLSGLDPPSLGARFPTRSFLVPGAHVSEALDTNAGQTAGTSAVNGVTRALGSLMLQKIGSRYM